MSLSKRITSAMIVLAVGSSVSLGAAFSQPAAKGTPNVGQLAKPRTARENVARLHRAISVDFKEWKLQDVIQHLSTETGAVFEPSWKSASEDGLDADMLITFAAKDLDGVTVLERVLEKASGEAITSDEKATWQMTSYGAIQIGPRKELNKSKRVEVYDVSDLLFEVPVYDDVPTIDLAQVLQNSGGRGGGGGGNIFEGGGSRGGGDSKRRDDRIQRRERLTEELKRLVTSLAEKEQWEENGGAGGSIRVYQGNLIVDAPDYMHRALAGYAWWPAAKAAPAKGRRYVAQSGSVEAAKVIGLTPFTEQGGAGGTSR